ncbi:hypothetical protein M885DRAFT_517790 [Pelagophyceae sp. CCMP2097]|nr:hypothetical protein M885DRAFT_517790 [Pelagophyceae sp. CCMP2097]
MRSITVRAAVQATPAEVWQRCFVGMNWESWDPDVVRMVDVSGGLVNGTTFKFEMKEGTKFLNCTLSNVVEETGFTFGGSAFHGFLCYEGNISLASGTAGTTTVTYSFSMGGTVGVLAATANRDGTLGGAQRGLENIVALTQGKPLPFP